MNSPISDSPTDFFLFGAKGDLSMRKLFPALYHLHKEGLLNPQTRITGVARQEDTREGFVEAVKATLQRFIPADQFEEKSWRAFSERLNYLKVDFTKAKDFAAISEFVDHKERVMVNYLATPPAVYGDICNNL